MERIGPFDVLVLGSGVAGLSAAARLAAGRDALRVAILTKGDLSHAATRWAQGGVAAVLGGDEDSTDLHLADTLAAGAGLCDEDAVRALVDEGPARVHELIALGAQFDREATGDLSLAREGGHSRARVVHAGGAATGLEVERALVAAARERAEAVLERWFALDLLVEGGRCTGVLALSPTGVLARILATDVLLATGGAGQLYAVTTNPSAATADGVAMALRAGVPVADVEFVQFHPTALHHPAMPRPLLSEALRGHGAILRDTRGSRFVDELAPRDQVSRAMAVRMAEQGVDHLWLDATGLDRFRQRFPTISASLHEIGLDPATDWLPIAPAAHHLSGGVVTDLWGATALPGLWSAGETACTGVHGANRLASNSLLEGMVFGGRVAEQIATAADRTRSPWATATGAMRAVLAASGEMAARDEACEVIGGLPVPDASAPVALVAPVAGARPSGSGSPDCDKLFEVVQRAMTAGAGVLRSATSLASAAGVVNEVSEVLAGSVTTKETGELANVVQVARALLASAKGREESRGAHARSDFPRTDPSWRLRLVHGVTRSAGR